MYVQRSTLNDHQHSDGDDSRASSHTDSPHLMVARTSPAPLYKTYSKHCLVANVFVPPDMERIMEQLQQQYKSQPVQKPAVVVASPLSVHDNQHVKQAEQCTVEPQQALRRKRGPNLTAPSRRVTKKSKSRTYAQWQVLSQTNGCVEQATRKN